MNFLRGLFVIVPGVAAVTAFLAYQPQPPAVVQRVLSQARQTGTAMAEYTVAGVLGQVVPASRVSSTPSPAVPGVGGPTLRIAAVREANNYGWIQLPRGAEVDLVERQSDGLLVRYDECFIRIPNSALRDGSVILRQRRGQPAS